MDMLQFAEAATAFKTALDSLNVLKGLKGISGDKGAQDEISKLHGVIISAQQSAILANIAQFQLVQDKRALEEKIAQFESWDQEKSRYELRDINPGRPPVFAYALKPETANGEPFHVLCAKCFEHRHKSLLQATAELRKLQRIHVCMECKSEYVFGTAVLGPQPAPMSPRYNPLAGA